METTDDLYEPGFDAGSVKLPASYALIVGGSPAPAPVSLLRSFAKSASCIIAADSGADLVCEASVSLDLLVGDFDSVSEEGLEYAASCGAEVLEVPAEKDFTDIQMALKVAAERGYENVILTSVSGGRLDHALAVIGACVAVPELQPLIVDEGLVVCVLSPSGRREVELADMGVSVGDTFSVLAPLGPSQVSERGTKWELSQKLIAPLDGLGVSNEVYAPDAGVTVHTGCVLVICATAQEG